MSGFFVGNKGSVIEENLVDEIENNKDHKIFIKNLKKISPTGFAFDNICFFIAIIAQVSGGI